jgi:hypothetical protein
MKRRRLELQFFFTYNIDIGIISWIVYNISNLIHAQVYRKYNDTYEETSYEKLSQKSCIQFFLKGCI